VAVAWSLRFPLVEIFNAESGELKQIARSLRMRFCSCSSEILSFGLLPVFGGLILLCMHKQIAVLKSFVEVDFFFSLWHLLLLSEPFVPLC
jgi:hypothetical protein